MSAGDDHPGAATRVIGAPYVPAVRGHRLGDEGQTESGPCGCGPVGTTGGEAPEDPLAVLGWHARARVVHEDDHTVAVTPNRDASPPVAVPIRVVDEGDEGALQRQLAAVDSAVPMDGQQVRFAWSPTRLPETSPHPGHRVRGRRLLTS